MASGWRHRQVHRVSKRALAAEALAAAVIAAVGLSVLPGLGVVMLVGLAVLGVCVATMALETLRRRGG